MNIHSFKFKILGILLLCTLLPLAAATQLLSFYAERNMLERAQDNISLNMDAQMENMENVLKSLEEMQEDMKNDSIIFEFANRTRIMEQTEKQEYCRRIFQQLKYYQDRISAIRLTNQVHSAYVYIPGQRMLFASDQTYFEDFTLWDVDFLKQYDQKGTEMLNDWIPTVPVNYETINYTRSWNKYDKLLSYCDVLRNDSNHVIAIFVLNLKSSFLDIYCNKMKNGEDRDVVVCDRTGKVFFAAGEELSFYQDSYPDDSIKCLGKSEKIKEDDKLVVSKKSTHTQWFFVTFTSKKMLLQDIIILREFMYKMVFVSGLIASIIAIILGKNIYKPLKKLISCMREVRNGNLKIRIKEECKNEYSEVYCGFNQMLDELNNTMDNLETEKILNKEAKIRLIQEQINPHFLYNTLDTIFSMAKINGENIIAKMVFSLSRFFRINLSNGKDIVTLREAINLTENYLTIQQIRFPNKFECHNNIPEELMAYMVPKFLLQPFVENSVIHGLERCSGQGQLYIEGIETKGILKFTIKDNGLGIPEEELIDIQKELSENTLGTKRHFAIANISSLIKLKYGKEYGIKIYSEWKSGTVVEIKIPAQKATV